MKNRKLKRILIFISLLLVIALFGITIAFKIIPIAAMFLITLISVLIWACWKLADSLAD